ncbi:MAG: hypothetical protein AAGA10_16520 [Bacteroidota bacterium]
MKLNKLFIVLGAALMLTVSCADEDLQPIITFDQATKGAYVRLNEESSRLVNLFDPAGYSYSYTVEFVDLNQGELVSEYVIDLVFEDNNSDNGDNSTSAIEFRRFSQADFETNTNGFRGLSNIVITGPEMFSAIGITADDVLSGDEFKFQGRVTTPDGTWGASNSSSTVNGPAFRGHFDYTLTAGCPSDLTGTYSYSSTSSWCGGPDATGEVTFSKNGDIEYNISDWSFGLYSGCYNATSVADSEGLKFKDVCNQVSFSGTVDSFGDTWTFASSVDGTEWTISWSNTYGESGQTVVVNPAGWSFTIVD